MIEFAANALFLFKMLLPSFSLDFSRITLLYHQSHINFHNSTCKTDVKVQALQVCDCQASVRHVKKDFRFTIFGGITDGEEPGRLGRHESYGEVERVLARSYVHAFILLTVKYALVPCILPQ